MTGLREGDTVLVTGGAGFIGSNLAHRLAEQGCRVRVLDTLARPGVEGNLQWLCSEHGDLIEPVVGDICSTGTVLSSVRNTRAVFHFAAQVAVTTSMEDPRDDFATNLQGTFNLLEAARQHSPDAPFIFASTNKVYGDLSDVDLHLTDRGYMPQHRELAAFGISESRPLDFHTPYGCSKGAADQYVLDYARSYGLRTAVMRMSCIYGPRQQGSEDQGWVAHFLIQALQGKPIILFGDGEQVRDVCHVGDACEAYLKVLERIDVVSGRAFNWGGGSGNAVSLLTVLDEIGKIIGQPPRVEFADWRPGDQRWFVADTRAADQALDLQPRTGWREGLRDLHAWLIEASASVQAEPQRARAAAAL